jgi:hypothetical protein
VLFTLSTSNQQPSHAASYFFYLRRFIGFWIFLSIAEIKPDSRVSGHKSPDNQSYDTGELVLRPASAGKKQLRKKEKKAQVESHIIFSVSISPSPQLSTRHGVPAISRSTFIPGDRSVAGVLPRRNIWYCAGFELALRPN